jgi:uncharacterized protein YaiI (UPF0178 family)
MKIWVDADACPGPVKDIVCAAANRRSVETIFVANKQLLLASSEYLKLVQVKNEPDAADSYIIEHADRHDLVITQDILLARNLVASGVAVIDPRGRKYTEDNIGEIVSTRNLMQSLRDGGEVSGGPKSFGNKEKQAFAAAFDQELSKLLRKRKLDDRLR